MSKLTLTRRMPIHSVIINWLKSVVKGITNSIVWIFTSFAKLISLIYRSIISIIRFLMNVSYNVMVVPFLPSYKVIFSLYQVVPGVPVNKNDSVHFFNKGTGKKAIKFYNDVLKSTASNRIVPSEVRLVKRRKTVAVKSFGPVSEIKKFNIIKK